MSISVVWHKTVQCCFVFCNTILLLLLCRVSGNGCCSLVEERWYYVFVSSVFVFMTAVKRVKRTATVEQEPRLMCCVMHSYDELGSLFVVFLISVSLESCDKEISRTETHDLIIKGKGFTNSYAPKFIFDPNIETEDYVVHVSVHIAV